MINLYYWTTPNGHKITIFLEEANHPYKLHPINISKGEQFGPDFLAIAPNNRIPAIVDDSVDDGKGHLSLFESGAILWYLAEKTKKLSHPRPVGKQKSRSGYFGRWQAWVPWPDKITISINTLLRKFPMP